MKEFTLSELAEYDGKDGKPAYVGYQGRVFDVTRTAMWDDGEHEGWHQAGRDLTGEHDDAPHGEHVLDYPQVGVVKPG